MKKLLLLLMLFIVSPRICINIEANNAIVSICNVIKKGMRFLAYDINIGAKSHQ